MLCMTTARSTWAARDAAEAASRWLAVVPLITAIAGLVFAQGFVERVAEFSLAWGAMYRTMHVSIFAVGFIVSAGAILLMVWIRGIDHPEVFRKRWYIIAASVYAGGAIVWFALLFTPSTTWWEVGIGAVCVVFGAIVFFGALQKDLVSVIARDARREANQLSGVTRQRRIASVAVISTLLACAIVNAVTPVDRGVCIVDGQGSSSLNGGPQNYFIQTSCGPFAVSAEQYQSISIAWTATHVTTRGFTLILFGAPIVESIETIDP